MRPGAPYLLAAAAASIAAAGARAQDMPAHHHMPMDQPAPAAAGPAAPALYTADDLAFLHHMTLHHRQALEMCALMEGRTDRADFLRFAGYVADAQRAESGMMQSMLDMSVARGMPAPMSMAHGDPPMAGMLSSAEMRALQAARGPEFERLWLQGMIFHHEGGLAMARAQELRQAAEGRQPYGLQVMVDDILVEQRAEITRMRGWLDAWGLAAPGDRRPPDVEVASPAAGAVVSARRPVRLTGVAVDDTGIAAVELAVHDLSADRWLHPDGSWGDRRPIPAETIGSGPASAAWRFAFTPPTPGRYAVLAEARDPSGKRAAAPEPWTVDAR